MFRRRPNRMVNTQGFAGVRIGRWIVWILCAGVEYLLFEGMRHSKVAGGNTGVYWTLMILTWIVFGAIERFLRLR